MTSREQSENSEFVLDYSKINLKPDLIEDLKEAFNLFDKDGSGAIDTEEFYLVLKSQGANPSFEEVQKLVDEIDQDGNGEVDLQEFLEIMSYKINQEDTPDDILQAFTRFDVTGSGEISAEEFRYVMK